PRAQKRVPGTRRTARDTRRPRTCRPAAPPAAAGTVAPTAKCLRSSARVGRPPPPAGRGRGSAGHRERSEERRVGKEWRLRGAPHPAKKEGAREERTSTRW